MEEEREEKKLDPNKAMPANEVNALDMLADALDNPVKREEPTSEDDEAAAPPLSRSQSDPTDTSSGGASSKHFRKQTVMHTPVHSVVIAAPAPDDMRALPPELVSLKDEPQPLLTPPPSPPSRTLPSYAVDRHTPRLQFTSVPNGSSAPPQRILPSYRSPVDILLPRYARPAPVALPYPPAPVPPPAAAMSLSSPSSPPPATASRKRRYAHPQAEQAHAARAVLARFGLRPPPNSTNNGN